MNTYSFHIDGHREQDFKDEVAHLLPSVTFHYHPGAAAIQFNGDVVTGYLEGLTDTAIYHVHVTAQWEGPDVQWFDKYKDLPLCTSIFSIVPVRYMVRDGTNWSSDTDTSINQQLHDLAFRYRRPGDRVMLPVDLIYGVAVSLGDYVPKSHGDGCTADRAQAILYNPFTRVWPARAAPPIIHGDSEYHNQLRMIMSYPFAAPRDVPFICTMMTLTEPPAKSEFVGELKKRDNFTFTVTQKHGPYAGDYGEKFKYVMSDPAGNKVVWWTGPKTELEKGSTYNVTATPSRHEDDDGVKTTFIQRLKVLSDASV